MSYQYNPIKHNELQKEIERARESLEDSDPVNHPHHYTNHPSGIECIQITEHMNFNLGNAMKYIWRSSCKEDQMLDLRKALWYIQKEIDRLARKSLKDSYPVKIESQKK